MFDSKLEVTSVVHTKVSAVKLGKKTVSVLKGRFA